MANVYLDNASTTPVDPEVKNAMERYSSVSYGNPGSLHQLGTEAKHAVDDARRTISRLLHCKVTEILFTSGGTEGNNLAIQGVARARRGQGKHIITTMIEHSSVLGACKHLEKEDGFTVTYLRVSKQGLIDLKELGEAIKKDTILISIGYANNEIGVIQDMKAISAIARRHKVPLHTDACQAAHYLAMDVDELGVDLMTINGAKLGAPKGVGALFKRTGVPMKPLFFGGDQEFGYRSGTENVAGIVGLAKALELAEQRKPSERERLTKLRDHLLKELSAKVDGLRVNGDLQRRLPNNINVTIPGIEGESLVLLLSEQGLLMSMGGACAAKSSEPSHVLTAIGLAYKDARASLRITLGLLTKKEDVDMVIKILPDAVQKLRRIR